MSAARCASCGSSQAAGTSFCGICGSPMSPAAAKAEPPRVARTVDDVEPIGEKHGTVPEAPASAAVRPAHLAPRPAVSAQSRAAASNVAAGTVIDNKYAIVRLLGQGGMGVVYLARDVHTGLEVVLKAVRSELAHRRDVRERTLAEGRVLGRIDHPNVVQLKAVVLEGEALWLVMQYIDGESLERRIDRLAEKNERLSIAEAMRLFRQIVLGIAAAHAEGVIHRDLKPANVLIRAKDQVAKVTDFGIAKSEDDKGEGRIQTKGVIGSVWYMSPEQVTGRRDLDKRVDIYALGIVLYQMLIGHVPFDFESDYDVMRAHAETPLPKASTSRGDVPAALDRVMEKACAKKREDRYASCEDLLAALDGVEAELRRAKEAAGRDEAAGAVRGAPTDAPGTKGSSDAPPRPVEAKTAAPAAARAPSKDGGEAPAGKSQAETPPPMTSTRPDADREGETIADTAPGGPRRRWGVWIALFVLLGAIGSVATLMYFGAIPVPPAIAKWMPSASAPTPTADPTPKTTAPTIAPTASGAPPTLRSAVVTPPGAPSTTASTTARPPGAALDALVGTWVVTDSKRTFDAVRVADALELRVRDPKDFAPAEYEAGEARFVLRTIEGETSAFAIEDRLRVQPPDGFTFNPKARATCQEVRTSAGDKPLRATFDGERLSVELIKVEPGKANFFFDKREVTSCVGLGRLSAAKVVATLKRATKQ